jgi:hypothetical protein
VSGNHGPNKIKEATGEKSVTNEESKQPEPVAPPERRLGSPHLAPENPPHQAAHQTGRNRQPLKPRATTTREGPHNRQDKKNRNQPVQERETRSENVAGHNEGHLENERRNTKSKTPQGRGNDRVTPAKPDKEPNNEHR